MWAIFPLLILKLICHKYSYETIISDDLFKWNIKADIPFLFQFPETS